MKNHEEIQKEFFEYFQQEKIKAKKEEQNLFSFIKEKIDFTEGENILKKFTECDYIPEINKRNVLLSSLVDKIPEKSNLRQVATPSLEGICFSPVGEGSFDVCAKYKREIQDKIKSVLIPQQIDIAKEFNNSTDFFVKKLKEFGDILKNNKKNKILKKKGNFFELSPNENIIPLFEVNSGKNLIDYCDCDVRKLLATFFPLKNQILSEICAVLFHVNGVFVYSQGSINFIQANKHYTDFFYDKQNDLKRKHRMSSKRIFKDFFKDFLASLKNEIDQVIYEKIKEEVPNAKYYETIKNRFGLFPEISLNYKDSDNEEKYLVLLIEILSKIENFITDFFENIYIQKDRFLSDEEINSDEKIKIYLKNQNRIFFTPEKIHHYLEGGRGLNIQIEDLLFFDKYKDEYLPILFSKILMQIFRKIDNTGKNKQFLIDFEQNVDQDLIQKYEKILLERGFKKESKLIKKTALMQLFSQFGVLSLIEKEKDVKYKELPENLRIIFNKYLKTENFFKIDYQDSN